MNIEKVTIKNFKKITDTVEFKLDLGLHLIMSSKNGVGKTTLLNAIVFGLFNKSGDTKGSSKTTTPTSRLINDSINKDMLVEIYFNSGIIIRRGLKPDIFEILKDNENLANTSSKSIDQEFLEKDILGLDYTSFMSTIFLNSKPNSIPFIYMTGTQRKEYIEKILDLRILFHMNESLKKKVSLKKTEEMDIQKELSWNKQQKDVLENELQRAKQQKIEIEKQIEIFYKQKEENISKLQNDILIKESQIKELEQMHILLNEKVPQDIEEKINSIKQEIVELENKKKHISTNTNEHEYTSKINTLTQQIFEVEQENTRVQAQIQVVQVNIIELNNLLLNINKPNLLSEQTQINTRLEELKNSAISRTAEKNAFVKNKENYHMCGECPTLTKIIGSFPEEEFNTFISEVKKEVTSLRERLNEIEQKLSEVQSLENKYSNLDSEVYNLQIKLNANKQKILSLGNDKNNTQTILNNMSESIQKEISLVDNLISAKQNDIQNQMNQIESRKNDIKDKISTYIDDVSSIQKNIEYTQSQQAPDIPQINEDALNNTIKSISELESKLEKATLELDELTVVKDNINAKDIKEAAIQAYIPIFEDKVNNLLEKFMSEDDFTIKAKLSDNFDVSFTKNGREVDMFSLSEGQKSSITFAFTFSFQYLLNMKNAIGMNMLLIDEILDIALSEGRLNNILEYLKKVSEEKCIYVVSHNPNLQLELFDSITEVILENNSSKYIKQ